MSKLSKNVKINMAPKRIVKVNNFDYKKLTASDVICPVCRSILIKPVTLPCSHGFCASCFEETTQNENLVCPLCRVRVSSWHRSATKSNKLINEDFWKAIQDHFPLQVRNKLDGNQKKDFDQCNTKHSNDCQVKPHVKAKSSSEHNKLPTSMSNKRIAKKLTDELISCSLPSTSTVKQPDNVTRKEKLAKYATKEYTCRILCQNIDVKEMQKKVTSESLMLKNKRIQIITESETKDDRSNSIESECLYFKPIDYRNNPPSVGGAPIKVPTRKPSISSTDIKIIAPSGQNQIHINHIESAFARLFTPLLPQDSGGDEKMESEQTGNNEAVLPPVKRKSEKSESNFKKRIRNTRKPSKEQTVVIDLCDNDSKSNNLSILDVDNNLNSNLKNANNVVNRLSKKLITKEEVKRALQEKTDYEFARKLQEEYNQAAKYVTRSTVPRSTASRQVKLKGIMEPYKVK